MGKQIITKENFIELKNWLLQNDFYAGPIKHDADGIENVSYIKEYFIKNSHFIFTIILSDYYIYTKFVGEAGNVPMVKTMKYDTKNIKDTIALANVVMETVDIISMTISYNM